jgi:hypothetical protein
MGPISKATQLAVDDFDLRLIADLAYELQFHAQGFGHDMGLMTGQSRASIDLLDMAQ